MATPTESATPVTVATFDLPLYVAVQAGLGYSFPELLEASNRYEGNMMSECLAARGYEVESDELTSRHLELGLDLFVGAAAVGVSLAGHAPVGAINAFPLANGSCSSGDSDFCVRRDVNTSTPIGDTPKVGANYGAVGYWGLSISAHDNVSELYNRWSTRSAAIFMAIRTMDTATTPCISASRRTRPRSHRGRGALHGRVDHASSQSRRASGRAAVRKIPSCLAADTSRNLFPELSLDVAAMDGAPGGFIGQHPGQLLHPPSWPSQ